LTEEPELGRSRAGAAAELAYHWLGAHELAKALPAKIRAGMEAEAVRALAEALLHYERALEIWDAAADAAAELPLDQVEVTRRAAEAANLAGEHERAIALGRSALELIDDRQEPAAAALAHERLGRYLWRVGRADEAMPECRRAVELMPAEPPSEDRALVVAALAQILALCNQTAESVALCEDAVAMAHSVGARAVEAHALNTIAANFSGAGRPDSAVEAARRALAIGRELDLAEEIGRSYVNGSDALDQAGRVDESIAFAQEGVDAARDLGSDRSYGDFLRAEIVGRLFRAGRWDEAETLLSELVDRRPTGLTACLIEQHLALFGAERGEFEDAERHAERARELGQHAGGSMWAGPLASARAEIAVWAGQPEAAAAAVRECLDEVAGAEYVFATAEAYDMGTRAAANIAQRAPGDEGVRERQAEEARALLERLDGLLAELSGPPPVIAVASRAGCAAELSRITGEDGPALWAEAQRLWDDVGDRYKAAYARWRRAEALLAEGGDRREAERLVREAYSVAEELRAAPLLEELLALARRARFELGEKGGDATSREIDQLDLTPRELEVLGLLALGRTNRDIAGELFISEKTASVHVSRILSKLGARNRAEAAAIAHRLGLQPEPA
jgi:DNA-binding CsgD family transcriptional regulator